jgi:site-specific recombinase XerD
MVQETAREERGQLYLGDAIHFFLSAKRAGGRSERTIDEYRKKLDLFQRWMAARLAKLEGDAGCEDNAADGTPADGSPVDAPYMDMGADDIEAYVVHLKERGLSDTSRKSHLAVLRSFFKTVSRRHKLLDPIEDLDEVRFHQRVPKRSYITRREAEMLLSPIATAASRETYDTTVPDGELGAVGDPKADVRAGVRTAVKAARRRVVARALAARDHAAFSAMVYAGLRIEETTALTVENLSFSREEEEVRVARGKGNKERRVPMSPKLRKSLRRYLRVRDELLPAGASSTHLFLNEKGARVTENTLRRRLYKWVRQSSIKKADLKPHDLRRTFGTWYLQENPGQVRELAELMGHSDLSQVMKYALSDSERARAGVAKL